MKTNSPGGTAEQVRAATTQLQSLQAELRRALCENALDLRQVLDAETLEHFKSAVDDVRSLTWPQVLAGAQPESEDVASAMQLHRMRRIRGMLEALQAEELRQLQPEVMQFLDEIERLVSQRTYIC